MSEPRPSSDHEAVARLEELRLSGQEVTFADVQEALRQSSDWWDVIFETAGIAVLLGSLEGDVVFTSPSFHAVFGYARGEIQDQAAIVAMTHPDDITSDLELFGELIQGARDHYQLEKRYFRKDGSLMWGRLTVMLLRDDQGVPRFVLAMTQDITETKNAQLLADQLRDASFRKEQALELNDNIVQGLVVAKMALEQGFDDKAAELSRRPSRKPER